MGDLDRGVVCACTDLWDCSEDLSKCQAPLPEHPDGEGGWDCAWTDVALICERPGDEQKIPAGGGSWRCRWVSEEAAWECTASPPSPSGPAGAGHWNCIIDADFGAIVCTQGDAGSVPADGDPPAVPPVGSDSTCVLGQRMWCEGSDFCGWGMVDCDTATGTWKTKRIDGVEELDCRNAADGRRPDTQCACYHYFFTAECCERADCLVAPGAGGQYGQICPANAGKLCDYCDPVLESSCTEPGGMCLMMKSKESFCVRGCETEPCPSSYKCINVTTPAGTTKQCVPDDMSCFK